MQQFEALIRSLADSILPIYLVDGQRRIAYANQALSEWLGLPADELIGQVTAYHTDAQGDATTAGVLGLCPPPSALAGERRQGAVSCSGHQGEVRHRRADFVPLAREDSGQWTVLGVLHATDIPPEQLAEPLSRWATADRFHRALAEWRQSHFGPHAQAALVGTSPAIRRVAAQVKVAATSRADALVRGPALADLRSVAEAIAHQAGTNTTDPIWRLDLSLTPPEEVQHTLAKGAGERGTLLLFDIQALTPSQQQQLLSQLANPAYPSRVVATLPSTLPEPDGIDRTLTQRLATIEIVVPPLADRLEDLPLISQWQLELLNRDNPKQVEGLTSEALQHLALYDWPGELPELHEVLAAAHQRAAGPLIQVGDLPPLIRHAAAHAQSLGDGLKPIDLDRYLEQVEELLVRRAMELASGNKAEAARLLSVTRPRLYRKLELIDGGVAPPPRRPPRPQPAAAESTAEPETEESAIEFMPIDPPDDGATP